MLLLGLKVKIISIMKLMCQLNRKCNLKVGVSETQLVLHLSQSFINDMLTGSGQCKCKKNKNLCCCADES